MRPFSTRLAKKGGTQSKCVEKTSAGESMTASTLKRPPATGCSVTV
jgi:hypothetical protein